MIIDEGNSAEFLHLMAKVNSYLNWLTGHVGSPEKLQQAKNDLWHAIDITHMDLITIKQP